MLIIAKSPNPLNYRLFRVTPDVKARLLSAYDAVRLLNYHLGIDPQTIQVIWATDGGHVAWSPWKKYEDLREYYEARSIIIANGGVEIIEPVPPKYSKRQKINA